MKKIYKSSLLLSLLLVVSLTYGQRTVTGTVTDAATGEGLIGVNVVVPGTTIGAVSDIDGNFSIKLAEGETQLEVSYIGYETQTIDATGNVINIALSAGSVLDEVVVIGYGTAKRRNVAGAVASLSSKDFNKGLIASPEQLIQGKFAGVQVTTNSGEPGAGINVRIRGTTSIRNGNNPLYVIDGIPLSGDDATAGGRGGQFGSSTARNSLNFLNPNNIQSIDILKDPTTTAIYGSRGANGVVVISTKTGLANRGVEYNFTVGFSDITKKYNILSAEEYRTTEGANILTKDTVGSVASNVDWQDEILQTGVSTNHSVAFGSGNSDGDYRVSFGFSDQNGIVKESSFQRISAGLSANKKLFNGRLKIGAGLDIASINDQFPLITDNAGFEGDLLAAALKSNPTANIYIPDSLDKNGNKIPEQLSVSEPNPIAMLQYSDLRANTLRALARINADLLITEGLTWKNIVGLDKSLSKRTDAYSSNLQAQGIADRGRLYIADLQRNNNTWSSFLDFNRDFGNIELNALAGYEYQKINRYSSDILVTDFATDNLDLMLNNMSYGVSAIPINSSRPIDELQSVFARVNVGLNNKLYLNGSVRVDGSTRFGSGSRYGIFPAISAKYILIEESGSINNIAVRASYGATGNQEFDHNLYSLRLRNSDNDFPDGGGPATTGGQANEAFENENLQWESTQQFGAGTDFAFLNYKLTGSLDVYRKNTQNLLLKVDAAQPAPAPFSWENVDGDIVNFGLELALDYLAVNNSNFTWDIGTVIGYNTNTVRNLANTYNTATINGQGLTGAYAQRIANDQPLFAYFLREFGGYDDNGISIYPEGDVQKFVGASPIPKVNVGLTNTLKFNKFDLNFFLNGLFGYHLYSNTENAFFTKGAFNNGRNVTADVINSNEGSLNAPDVSTRFLYKGDFVRLQNLTLGYTLPINTDFVDGIRIFLTGSNLLTFTSYPFQDPEVNVNKSLDGIPSFGIDYTAYPRARTIQLGANINFK